MCSQFNLYVEDEIGCKRVKNCIDLYQTRIHIYNITSNYRQKWRIHQRISIALFSIVEMSMIK